MWSGFFVNPTGSGAVSTDGTAVSAEDTYYGQISLDSTSDISFSAIGTALADAGLSNMGNATTTLYQLDISSREGATTAISSVDLALAKIDTMRGQLGAIQNRFESTIANLNNVSENLGAARSRILDADISQETSVMTMSNILQQAGVFDPGAGQSGSAVGFEPIGLIEGKEEGLIGR